MVQGCVGDELMPCSAGAAEEQNGSQADVGEQGLPQSIADLSHLAGADG